MKRLALATVLAGSLLFAGGYKYEITPTIGGVMPEGNLDLDDALSYGLRFGINLDDCILDQIELGFERSDNVDYDNSTKDTDINRYFVNGIKSYPINSNLSWYGLVGVGYEEIKNELFGNDDSGFFNYGVGLKYLVNENFALRAEVRHAIKFDHGDNNLFYTLGFVIPFGKKAESAPIPKPEPQMAPKPVKEKVFFDDDKDGVINDNDICPQTPAGVKVDERGCEIDSDGDGVVDSKDKCPGTLAGIKVDKDGCEKDSDKDGVLDSKDMCPNTPLGNVVKMDGCTKIIRLHVNFDTDRADIKEIYMSQIKKVADFMKVNKNYKVILEGHTDSRGSEAYNMKLSKRRALSVAKALENLGVSEDRISIKAYGESRPIASNATKEGRAQNRRVDAKFIK